MKNNNNFFSKLPASVSQLKLIFSFQYLYLLKFALRWTLLSVPAGAAIGSLVAFFLWSLNAVIHFRFAHPWLLYLLPVAGIIIHFIYKGAGSSSEKGNNLIIEEIHQPGGGVPRRMGPVIMLTTLITHLFGGSAGREGTAVQIGGSMAGMLGKWFKLSPDDTRLMLTAGVAAGFGAVFGTPLTGAIFSLEVLTTGRVKYHALFPALIASLAGDITIAAWGVHHTAYHIDAMAKTPYFLSAYLPVDILLLIKIVAASVAFGMAANVFAFMAHHIKSISLNIFPLKWLIPVFGGLIIIALTFILGQPDYLGLGIDAQYTGAVTIPSAFHTGGAEAWSWLWKTIYTTVTVGTGFKGGEVTPLFYIGATLGNTLSGVLNAPVSLLAALGFIAVFAGATNTPLACTFMGIELFGGEHALLFAIACFTAYLFSGNRGIYTSQRIAAPAIEAAQGSHGKHSGYLRGKLHKYGIRTANRK